MKPASLSHVSPRPFHMVARAVELFSLQLEHCISGRHLELGQILHGRLLKTSLAVHTFLANRLIEMYAKCDRIAAAEAVFAEIPSRNVFSWNALLSSYCRSGCFDSAVKLLEEMPEPDVVSYNAVISGFKHFGRHREALKVFRRMQRGCDEFRLEVDKFTIVAVAGACGGAFDLHALKQIHGAVVSMGLDLNLIMCNSFIDAYAKCGEADTACKVFEGMKTRDVFSWTSMVTAFASEGRLQEAHQMFDRMPKRNPVSWSTLIAGYAQHGQGDTALNLFKAMVAEGFTPTAFALVSTLGACASGALVDQGRQIHCYIRRTEISLVEERHSENLFIQNSLIDMYAKCGDMNSALKLFERMGHRDIISWNSMITGFAQNGDGEGSLAAFKEMTRASLAPNSVSFLAAFSACSHAGLITEACQLLALMRKHGLNPQPEHYAAVVDLLGRSRHLKEAVELTTMAAPVDSIASWGAILGACNVPGDLELARRASEVLFAQDPSNAGRYIALSNIYASAGHWEAARKLRKLMKEKGFKKEPARSWIEVYSVKHAFVAEDLSHCQTEDIYRTITFLADHSKDRMDSAQWLAV